MLLFSGALILTMLGSHGCRLGLTVNVSVGGGARELGESILAERRMGCDAMQSAAKWSDLEPQPGQFNLAKLRKDFSDQARLGFAPIFTLKTIDTNVRALPADLMTERWDSPMMLARETAFLQAVATALPEGIGPVMLGNEVDGYLAGHPGEVGGFLRFLAVGRKTLRASRPGIQVGVTTMFTGLANNLSLIKRLQGGMDIVTMTYYPLHGDFTVWPVSDVPRHFEQMLAVAGDRNLCLQEAGYPASPLLGSSGEKQAAFVDALFDAMAQHRYRLYAVCYFIMIDFSDALVDSYARYYGLQSHRFRAMLSTLGLKDQHGIPRPAWSAFLKRTATFFRQNSRSRRNLTRVQKALPDHLCDRQETQQTRSGVRNWGRWPSIFTLSFRKIAAAGRPSISGY